MKTTKGKAAIKIIAIALILSLTGAFAACQKNSKVPSKEEFVNKYQNEPDPHDMKQLDYTREELLKAWGEPDIRQGVSSAWKCGDKYIITGYNSDDPDKIDEMYVSITGELVYLFSNTSVIYVCLRENGTTDFNSCYMMEDMYLDRDDIENLTMGMILQIEFDGFYLESYPGQFSMVCSVKTAGQVPDEELPQLETQAQYIRDGFTGEM